MQISSTFLHESLKAAPNPSPPELPPRLPAKTAQKTQPLEAAEETTPFVRADSQLSQVSSVAFEGIYDIVPTPRSCLSRRQLEYNDIYDVPRKLIAKNQHQNSAAGRRQQQQQPAAGVMHQRPPSFDRSVSVFDTRHSSKRVRSTSTVSVGKMPEDTAGIRRANYVSNLGIFSSQVTVCQLLIRYQTWTKLDTARASHF